MSEISRVKLFEKLNGVGYKAIESATVFCKLRGNPYVELVHWFNQILQTQDSDIHRIVRYFQLDPAQLARDFTEALERLPRGATSILDLSARVEEAVERGWVYGSLMFGDAQVRTGHLLVGVLKSSGLRNALGAVSREFDKISVDRLAVEFNAILGGSPESSLRAAGGTAASPRGAGNHVGSKDISRVKLFEKLNSVGYKAFESASVSCNLRGNPYVELVHWFHEILQMQDSDIHRIVRHFQLDPVRLADEITEAIDRLPREATSISEPSSHVEETVERGWVYGSLMFSDEQVRTGHLLVGVLKSGGLRKALGGMLDELDKVKVDRLTDEFDAIVGGSPETLLRAAGTSPAPGVHAIVGGSPETSPRAAGGTAAFPEGTRTGSKEISRVKLFEKLNSVGRKTFESATVSCKLRGNPYVELVHWFHQILPAQDSDLHRIVRHFQLDPARLAKEFTEALDRLPRGATSIGKLPVRPSHNVRIQQTSTTGGRWSTSTSCRSS